MKHAIILFIALLIAISAASADCFVDTFSNRTEDYTNLSNGWQPISSTVYGYSITGLVRNDGFSGKFSALGGMMAQNFSNTISWDFNQGAKILYYQSIPFNGTLVDMPNYQHCIFFIDKNQVKGASGQFGSMIPDNGIQLCSDFNSGGWDADLYMKCYGNCSCNETTIFTGRNKSIDNPPYTIINYDGSGIFNISRDDNYSLINNMSGCNLNDMTLALGATHNQAYFEVISVDALNGTNCSTYQDVCLPQNGCILYQSFPYSDSIYNHGWADLTGNPLPDVSYIASGYSLRFNNYDGMFLNNIDIYKNFTNPANYNLVSFRGIFAAIENMTFFAQNNTIYMYLKNDTSITVKIKFVYDDSLNTLETYYMFNGGGEFLLNTEDLSLVPQNTWETDFTLNYLDNLVHINDTLLIFYNNNIPDRIEFYANESDSTAVNFYAHSLRLNGSGVMVVPNITYQCNDGIDNDNDTFIDYPIDLGCTNLTDNSELPFNTPIIPQCNDSIDNDADGFIDYPADPACLSLNGSSEFPQNFYQCNNGIDDDGDTLIDYPADPSCTSPYATTELPKQGTSQPNDACPIASMCLLKDTFPYTDDLVLHNWTYDSVAGFTTYNCTSVNNLPDCGFAPSLTGIGVGDYALNLARSNRDSSSYRKNFSNPNLYTNNIADFRFVHNGVGTQPESINLTFGDNAIKSLRIYLNIDRQNTYTIGGNQFNNRIGIYASSAGSYYFAGYAYTKNLQEFKLRLVLDNNLHNYIIQYDDGTVSNFTTINISFNYDNLVVPNRLDMTSNAQGNEIFLISANVYGAIIQAQTTCNTFTKPKYLYETFDYGLLSDCKWVTNKPISVFGEFNIDNGDGEISAYKYLQYNGRNIILTSTMSRYVTAQWDEYIDSESDDISNTYTVFILDSLGNTVSTIFFNKQGGVYLSEGGNPTLVANSTTIDTIHTIKLIFDLTADTQTLIIDGSTVALNVPLLISGFNYNDIASFQISSVGSQYKIDNVIVYTSDATGGEVIVTPTPLTNIINGTYWGGLFFTETPTCLVDADCQSGKCMSYGTCSSFNWYACDEAGKTRDNFCIITEMTYSAFSWVAGIIWDNFFFFILFLIMMMILVYLTIMFRSKR